MIPRDKAIAALSEINQLRHQWELLILDADENTLEEQVEKAVYQICKKNLSTAIERAYAILNEKD